MTIVIPTWLLWTLGIVVGVPGVIVILFLAMLGLAFVRCFGGGLWR